jgi:HTH-type transcriptional regulator/antitoxin HigA
MDIKAVKTKKDYQRALKRIEELFDSKLNTPKGDELDILVTLVDRYEEVHYPIPAPDPIEAIRFMMEQMGIDDSGLGDILKSRSRASEILNKKRKLSIEHIRRIKKHLNIPADILIKDYKLAV